MDAIILFAWRAWERIGGWVDDLFHAPFWKVMAGAVIVTLSLFAVSALVNPGRNKIKPAALLGGLGSPPSTSRGPRGAAALSAESPGGFESR